MDPHIPPLPVGTVPSMTVEDLLFLRELRSGIIGLAVSNPALVQQLTGENSFSLMIGSWFRN